MNGHQIELLLPVKLQGLSDEKYRMEQKRPRRRMDKNIAEKIRHRILNLWRNNVYSFPVFMELFKSIVEGAFFSRSKASGTT